MWTNKSFGCTSEMNKLIFIIIFVHISPVADIDFCSLSLFLWRNQLIFSHNSCSCLGMKVYVTDEKELIMEPSIKWAGNPNVLVAAKAFGLKATVQVKCLLFYSMVKILTFLDTETEPWPFFFPVCLATTGYRFASFCSSTYYLEAIGSELSLFCEYLCFTHGKGFVITSQHCISCWYLLSFVTGNF